LPPIIDVSLLKNMKSDVDYVDAGASRKYFIGAILDVLTEKEMPILSAMAVGIKTKQSLARYTIVKTQ